MMHTRFAGRISFLFCAALLHAAVVASGETYTWTGAADNTWKNEGNWEGGKVALIGNFTNDIAHLILDGNDRAKHTYGGMASPAERKLSKYFVEKEGNAGNLGVFNVTEGGGFGTLLFVR